MYKIYRVETDTEYIDDNFATYEDALEMAQMFIDDDKEYDEPPYTYLVLDENDKFVAMLKDDIVFEKN